MPAPLAKPGSDRLLADAMEATRKPLPESWRAAIAFCPYCDAGLGYHHGDPERLCLHCQGSGDYFGTLLREAYKLGVQDTRGAIREMGRLTIWALQQVNEPPNRRELRVKVGLP